MEEEGVFVQEMRKQNRVLVMICYRNINPATGEGRLIVNRASSLYTKYGIHTRIFALVSERHRQQNKGLTPDTPGLLICQFAFKNVWGILWALYQLVVEANRFIVATQAVKGIIFSGSLSYFTYPFLVKTGKKIIDIHGALEEWLEYPPLHIFKNKIITRIAYAFWSFLEQHIAHKMDAALVVTQELGKHIQTKYGCNCWFVIPCGLHKILVKEPQAVREHWRNYFGFLPHDIVVTYSGSLASWQMIPETIDFFLSYRKMNSQAKLLLLVTDPDQVRQIYSKRGGDESAAVIGRLSASDALEAMLAADIGVMLREKNITNKVAFPNKFAEYLAGGLIVVTSPGLTGPAQMVLENRLGIIQDPYSEKISQDNTLILDILLARRDVDWLEYYEETANFCYRSLDIKNYLDRFEEWL